MVRRSAWVHASAAAVISTVFVVIQVILSRRNGTLSLPPTYDDVVYFVDAAGRLDQFWSGGLPAVLAGYAAHPPHAPGSTFLAMLGFSVHPNSPGAAALAN